MRYNPNHHHCRSIRLSGYDYAQSGAYFVTLCVKSRVPLIATGQANDVSIWQCNYYEHIIRNTTDLQRIRAYSEQNPARWDATHSRNKS